MKYTDEQRLDKIKAYTDKLIEYVNDKNITREDVLNDETIRWALTTPLYNIGENTYHLSDGLKDENKDIPWNKISGLRHRLVHDYESTNWNIICDIVFDVIPEFKKQLALVEVKVEEVSED